MLHISAILTKFTSLKDKTLKIEFETNEPTPEQFFEIATCLQSAGYLAFNKDVFKTEQLKVIEDFKCDYDDKTKTPSKRLKSVMYLLWKQEQCGYKTDKDFYDHEMEKIINHYKDKLE